MPMLDEFSLGDFFAPWLGGQPMAMPPSPAPGKGDMAPYSPNARVDRAFAALPPAPPPTAPALPPPIDVASLPVAGAPAGAPLTDPFQLGVGQSGTLEDAALPAGATPTIGTGMPVPAAAAQPDVPPSSLLGRIGGKIQDWIGDHRAELMALGSGMAGAQNFGQGMQRAGQLMGPALQQDVKQQNVNATVRALMNRGLPQDAAIAAAANPTLLAQILPQAFGVKQRQFTQIGEDMLGNKRFGFVDPVAGKVYNLDGTEVSASGGGGIGGGNIPTGPDGMPLQGQALLAHLEQTDPVTAAGIKGLLAGNVSAQGRNLQKLAPLASLVDPTFSMATYPARVALQKSYMGGGKDFQETQALNTVGGHMNRLMESADGLNNTNFKPWNWLKNQVSDATIGNPALVKFRNDLVTTQNELAKAYHGGHVSDSAYNAFNKAINEAQTPAEMKAAIGELAGLLQSKIEAKESGYRTAMSNSALPNEYRALNDEAQHSFKRIGAWVGGTPLSQLGPAPGVPKTGAQPPQQQQAVPAPAQRQVGQVYQTPKGSFRWMGTGWAQP